MICGSNANAAVSMSSLWACSFSLVLIYWKNQLKICELFKRDWCVLRINKFLFIVWWHIKLYLAGRSVIYEIWVLDAVPCSTVMPSSDKQHSRYNSPFCRHPLTSARCSPQRLQLKDYIAGMERVNCLNQVIEWSVLTLSITKRHEENQLRKPKIIA